MESIPQDIFENAEVSYRAIGVYLSLVASGAEVAKIRPLVRGHSESRDAIRAAVNELVAHGYLVAGETRWKRPDGRLPPEQWAQLRQSIFERDDFTCRYCGEKGGRLECDHIVPVSRGGGNDPANLATSCYPCNRDKRDRTPEEWKGRRRD